MNETILVEVYLPVTAETYDVRIRNDATMMYITKLIANALADLSDGLFLPSADTVLCDRVSGTIFNINLSVSELGLRTGSKLILI